MNQKRTIMGACDYSLAYLKSLRKNMMDVGSKHQQIAWAIGGIVVTLTSNLIKACEDTFGASVQCGEPSARKDLLEIKDKFNAFIDRMLENESI